MTQTDLLRDIAITRSANDTVAPNSWIVSVGNLARTGPYGGTIYPLHNIKYPSIRGAGSTMDIAIKNLIATAKPIVTPIEIRALEQRLSNLPSVPNTEGDIALTLSPNDRHAPNAWVLSHGEGLVYPIDVGDNTYHIHNRRSTRILTKVDAPATIAA